MASMSCLIYTQVYCVVEEQVLLMYRHQEPNLGLWVAPGGKVERTESPVEGAARELREETGLAAEEIHLRGVLRCVLVQSDRQCLQFLYLVTRVSGELMAQSREGTSRWWPVAEARRLPMPPSNAQFLPHVLDVDGPVYQARYTYDASERLVGVVEHPPLGV